VGGAVKALGAPTQNKFGSAVGIFFDFIVPDAKNIPT
jgi:hypothetical protein